jgi:PIN domain nuclease of toxin-antitoxin system
MIVAVMDTHALLWHLMEPAKLSLAAANVLNQATADRQVGVSSISLAEIVYLEEKSRVPSGTLRRVQNVLLPRGPFVEVPLTGTVVLRMTSIDRAHVPDFPDRLIAATALANDVPLVTCDGRIRASSVPTVW